MDYNYRPPGAYGSGPPGMHPPGMNPPPGMGMPPGGMPAHSPANMHQAFQPPPNMPANFNMNARVIRMGVPDQGRTSSTDPYANRQQNDMGGRGPRPGVGADRGGNDRNVDRDRAAVKESMASLQAQTREEIARTIFVGGLGEGTPTDASVEAILRCAGSLRRWTRARDAEDKLCKFGFAEYENVESLEAANAIFEDIEVPLFKNGQPMKNEDGEPKHAKLLVVVDEQSKAYIEEWKVKKDEPEDTRQFRLDGCKDDLRQCLAGLANSQAVAANQANSDGDAVMSGTANGDAHQDEDAEVVTITAGGDDDLSDLVEDLRPQVLEEIKRFRERSMVEVQRARDNEDRHRAAQQSSFRRGSAEGVNAVPVGPRRGSTQGVPSGPRGDREARPGFNHENEDAEESDEELENRRVAKIQADKDAEFQFAERKWLTSERARVAAHERESVRDAEMNKRVDREKENYARELREWDDEKQARSKRSLYYEDRSSWNRKRSQALEREEWADEKDRIAEANEAAEERKQAADARGAADDFLNQTASELASRPDRSSQNGQAGFGGGVKISLGSAAAKAAAPTSRRTIADIEGLLDDEDDATASGRKRPQLKPLTDMSTIPTSGQDLSDEERDAARRQLIAEVPTDTQVLFDTPVKWKEVLRPGILDDQIRPYVEKRVVEYLGVQEDMLVDAMVDGIREKSTAKSLVEIFEEALGDDSETFVRKVWRMLVYWGEAESRGLL